MDDLIKSLKAHLYDRVSSPLFFSFSVSWLLWNYRLVLLFFATDLKYQQKINVIDLDLYPTHEAMLFRGLALPLISALVYLFIYPYPAKFVFRHIQLQQKELKQIQQGIEDDTPITQEEARSLRKSLRDADRESDKVLAEREKTIQSLQSELDKGSQENDVEITSLKAEIAELEARLAIALTSSRDGDKTTSYANSVIPFDEREVLEHIARNDSVAEKPIVDTFFRTKKYDAVRVKYLLDNLMEKKLIISSPPLDANGSRYSATKDGRANLINVSISTQ